MKRGSFEYHVTGLEDCIVGALAPTLGEWVKEIATYGGELDEKEKVAEAIRALAPRFPLILVSYTDGDDSEQPATAKLMNTPLVFNHTCYFTLLCCDNNVRGEKERRRGDMNRGGVYRMISEVREIISGRRFFLEQPGGEEYFLNHTPFVPAGVENITRLKGISAYAVHFDTSFLYETPDRRGLDTPVSELLFELEPTDETGTQGAQGKPGVEIE